MSDEDTRNDETQESADEAAEDSGGDLIEEIDKLGRDVTQGITDAWKSDERKEIQDEVEKGLGAAGRELGKIAEDVGQSDAAQELKKGAKEAGKEIHKGLLSGLRFLNRELGGDGKKEGGDGGE